MLFISPSRLFTFLRYLSLCLEFLAHLFKGFDEKDQIDFEIYETNNCNTNIAQYSRSKGVQKIKFGSLIEHNMRNIFVQNHTQNVVEKLFPDSFIKNQN